MNDIEKKEEIKRIQDECKRRESEIPSDRYDSNKPVNRFSAESRKKAMSDLLLKENLLPLRGKFFLEVGCGSGGWLVDFERWGVEESFLSGIDLQSHRISQAKRRLPRADLRVGEASELPWPDQSFDLVLQSTVFTSILSGDLKKKVALEMIRVLKKDGAILWYDFFVNNPFNSHVSGVSIEEIKESFQGFEISFRKLTLAPPIARFIAPISVSACVFLEKGGLLNTHYLACIRRKNK